MHCCKVQGGAMHLQHYAELTDCLGDTLGRACKWYWLIIEQNAGGSMSSKTMFLGT